MVGAGYRLSRAGQRRPDKASSKPMTPIRAFSVAAGLTIIKLPSALLYFAAIDQILRADLSATGITKALLFYNALLVLPLALVVLSAVPGWRPRMIEDLSRL